MLQDSIHVIFYVPTGMLKYYLKPTPIVVNSFIFALGHSAVSEKKENTSNSPTSDLTKSKRHSLSPAMESLQATTASTQQVIKQPKVSLKSGTRKNQKSVEVVKDNETVSYPPNGNQNEHQSTQLNSTSTVKHSSKTAKRNGGLSLASPHLKVPLVEIKAISKDSISSPKKRSKSDSLSKGEDGFSTDVCMEDVGGVVSPKGGLHNGNDVVHCVCGDVTDEGFMIQVSATPMYSRYCTKSYI